MVTGDEGHITNVAVHPDRRRRHLASRMLLVMFREAIGRGVTDLTLEVRMSNHAAQELYRRFGFAPGGVRKNYYSDVGEDALIMWANDITSDRAAPTDLDSVSAQLRHWLIESGERRG